MPSACSRISKASRTCLSDQGPRRDVGRNAFQWRADAFDVLPPLHCLIKSFNFWLFSSACFLSDLLIILQCVKQLTDR